MADDAILGQVALGYSPFIDKKRAVSAMRLTVFPLQPDLQLDAAQLLAAVGQVWPADGGKVSLNVASESLLLDLMSTRPAANLMVEVPAFMACEPANSDAIRQLHASGTVMLIKGRPLRELPREVLPCFRQSIIDIADDRRTGDAAAAPPGISRNIGFLLSGIRSVAEMEAAFARGAEAVLGWPIDDPLVGNSKPASLQLDIQVVVELINRLDREDPIERLELTLKRDPSLAFKLLRYINSPGFGLSVEVNSFRHAILLLGYKRLKRWLALLLTTASKDPNMKPVMFASVRRGLLMEELVRGSGDDEMRNEMFICGVFSLLHRLFKQPLDQLLKTIPVPQRVFETLVDGTGPYTPYFELVQAIEAGSLYDFSAAAESLMMSVQEINRAVLRALSAATQLE